MLNSGISHFGLASLIANNTIEKCATNTAGTSPDDIKMSTGFTLINVEQWSLAQQRSCAPGFTTNTENISVSCQEDFLSPLVVT